MSPLVMIHVITGYLSLLLGLIIMIMPNKGNSIHSRLGKFFFILMLVSGSTAVIMSLLFPNRLIFLFIGIFTLHSLLGGYVAVNKRYKKWRWALLPLAIIGVLNGAYMIYTGVVVLIIFGSLQLILGITDFRMYLNKNIHPLQVVKAHAGKMAGSFTAATTAFTVNVIFSGGQWWHWILPTLIITPISTWWGIKLDKKRKKLSV